MNSPLFVRSMLVGSTLGLVCLAGCPAPKEKAPPAGAEGVATQTPSASAQEAVPAPTKAAPAESAAPAPSKQPQRQATAKAEDVEAAKKILDGLGGDASYKLLPGNVLTEIVVDDGSKLSPDAIALFGKLSDLETLQIFDYRGLNDEIAQKLSGLKKLTSLKLTNSVIGDPTVEMIAASFPELKILDLSYNPNMTNGALKVICTLTKLQQLLLLQNNFNDIGTGYLEKLTDLRVLDLRGNMEAGDMTLEIVASLPKLVAFKHRSTAVSDMGMESLAANKTLKSLLIQDFIAISDQAGQYIAQLPSLQELEIFRCQGFGSQGVLALKGTKLSRLTLRDLPMIDDQAADAFTDLPQLKRLYLHELQSLSDTGLASLGALQSLELLDIWTVPQMTDATVDVIAKLPNLKELSIRTTGVSDAAIDKILAMPKLESLTFKENASVTEEGLKKLAGKKWKKLDAGK